MRYDWLKNMNVTLRIETRTIIQFITTLAGFGLLIFAVLKLSEILLLFLVAFFLALALNPPVTRIAGYMPHHSRVVATAIAYVLVLAVLGTLVYVAAPPIVQQTNSFVNNFPEYVGQLSDKDSSFSGVIERYGLQDEINRAIESAKGESGDIAQGVGSSFINGVSSILNGTIATLTILVLTFLMLIEGPSWFERFWRLHSNPRKLKRDQRVLIKMYKVVSGYVNGQVLVAAIGAASVFVVLFVLTRIFPEIPLGAIMPLTGIAFIAALIPMFGATIAAVIITAVLLFNSIPGAIIFLAFFLIYQQIENNVIQPVVQSRTIQISALTVFSAAIIGIVLLGIVGAIIAIPIAGCLRVLLLDYTNHREDYDHHSASNSKVMTVGEKKKTA